MASEKVPTGQIAGWVSNPYSVYEMIYYYQVPVYKKKNIKKANSQSK